MARAGARRRGGRAVLRPVVERLDELRLSLTEERFELLFRLGQAAEAIDALRTATRENPTRERFWGQLMTALHREHRTQEALEAYAEARAVMADELGIEPSEALQRIERRSSSKTPLATPTSATTRCRARPPGYRRHAPRRTGARSWSTASWEASRSPTPGWSP